MKSRYKRVLQKYRSLLLVAVFGLAQTQITQAQDPVEDVKVYSIDEAVNFALKNNQQIKIADFDEFIARKQVVEFTSVGLPQVEGGFNFIDQEIIPTTIVPANNFDPSAPPGTNLELQFGIQYTAKANITASQLLFSGSYIFGLRAAKEFVKLTKKQTEATKVTVAENVTKAYYSALIAQENSRLLDINVERVKNLRDNTKALYEEGFVEKLDYDRLEITYLNLENERQNTKQLVELTFDMLKFQMGLDVNDDILLTDTMSIPEKLPFLMETDITMPWHLKRVEWGILQDQETLNELNAKRIKATSLPTFAAFGDFGGNGMSDQFGDVWKSSNWFPYLTLGLQMNVPLFTGFKGSSSYQQAKAEADKVRINQDLFKKSVSLQVKSAYTSVTNAYSTLNNYQRTLDMANEVYRVTNIKYKEGVGSNLEVIEAETTLRETQAKYLSALYEYYLATVELKKAQGKLVYN